MTGDTGRVPTAEWKPCPGFERFYVVSSEGEVASLLNGKRRDLVGDVDRYGYRRVLLSLNGRKYRRKVHRLICEAFHGPAPEKHEVAHTDGDKQNNAAANLRWATRRHNMEDNALHGVAMGWRGGIGTPRGENHRSAKMTTETATELRRRAAEGESGRALARAFGISEASARNIINGKNWRTR